MVLLRQLRLIRPTGCVLRLFIRMSSPSREWRGLIREGALIKKFSLKGELIRKGRSLKRGPSFYQIRYLRPISRRIAKLISVAGWVSEGK